MNISLYLHTRLKYIGITLIMLIACLCLQAQRPSIHIHGSVTDRDGAPLELAMVRVLGQPAATLTNLKGKYQLNCTSADSIMLTYSLIGYDSKRRLLLTPSDTILINITLNPSGVMLEAAEVKAEKVQTGQTQHIQTGGTKLMPSSTGNAVEELIATQAGVSSHNELSAQYNVRGGSFDENSVYLNGIELFRPMLVSSGQQEGLSVINSQMVDKIGFSTGGFEAKYGDKMSSVLDITYKRVRHFEASVQGSLLGGGAYIGWGNKRISWLSSIRYKTNQYLLSSLDTKGAYNPRFLDYQTYLSWQPTAHWTLDFIGNISDNTYHFAPADRETKFGTLTQAKSFKVYFDGQERDYFRTYFGALNLTRQLGESSSISLLSSAFLSKENEAYDIQGQYWLNETQAQERLGVGTYMEHARNNLQMRVSNVGLRYQTMIGKHRLQAGVTMKFEIIRENAREWEMRDSLGYSLPYNPQRLDLIYSLRSYNAMRSTRTEAFVQDSYRLQTSMGLFTFHYGLRLAHWSWNKETLLSPRLQVGYLPTGNNNLTLRFATGVYHQAPFYKELKDTMELAGKTIARLSHDTHAQQSLHFVLGGDYNFKISGRPFRFTTEVYYKWIAGFIPYTVDNLRIVYDNKRVTDSYTTGIDMKLYGEFVPGTNSWVTFSLMTSKQKAGSKWFPTPTDQRYNISAFFTDYFPGTDRWLLTLKGAFADGLPFAAPHSNVHDNAFRAPAYKRVDIGMSYRLLNNEDHHLTYGLGRSLRNIWIGLDAFNVFGLNNVSSYYWVTDIANQQYAVPNFLTGRQLNLRFLVEF